MSVTAASQQLGGACKRSADENFSGDREDREAEAQRGAMPLAEKWTGLNMKAAEQCRSHAARRRNWEVAGMSLCSETGGVTGNFSTCRPCCFI